MMWRKGWDWGYVLADVDQWPEECYFLEGIKYIRESKELEGG